MWALVSFVAMCILTGSIAVYAVRNSSKASKAGPSASSEEVAKAKPKWPSHAWSFWLYFQARSGKLKFTPQCWATCGHVKNLKRPIYLAYDRSLGSYVHYHG